MAIVTINLKKGTTAILSVTYDPELVPVPGANPARYYFPETPFQMPLAGPAGDYDIECDPVDAYETAAVVADSQGHLHRLELQDGPGGGQAKRS